MTDQSMVKKVIKNTGLGILFKLLLMILTFANRTVFIHTLNEDYLGINGLFSNILSVLALADLGVNTVLMFFLYEPLANGDHEKLGSLIKTFRKIYVGIAAAVAGVGALMIPFLPLIITGSTIPMGELTWYYVLYVVNSAASYLAVYKSTLLLADQKAYLVNFVHFIVAVLQNLAYIAVLYITHNYTLYLCAMISGTVLNNIILTAITNRHYPYIKKITAESSSKEVKIKIIASIKSVFLYRVGATVMNSTDNILISMILSTAMVGFYSNYVLITANLLMLLSFFSQAVMASLGNYNVKASKENQEKVFRTVQLIYFGIGSFCAACLVSMMNDFMNWWIRNPKYILPQSFVYVLAFKLFVDIIMSPNWMFREASGLFKEIRYTMLWAAFLNVGLSVILGLIIGLHGIVLATVVSKLLTLFWYEPKTFYHKVFNQPLSRYWLYQGKLILVAICVIVLTCILSINIGSGLGSCVLKVIVSGIVTLGVFIFSFYKTEEGFFLKGLLKIK